MKYYYHISNYLVVYRSKHIVGPNEESYAHILLPNLNEKEASSFLANPAKYLETHEYPYQEDIEDFRNGECELVNSLDEALYLNPHELLQCQQHENE